MSRGDDSEFSGRVEAHGAEAANLLQQERERAGRLYEQLAETIREKRAERERAEAAEQRLKAAEAAHKETARQLALNQPIETWSDGVCLLIAELLSGVASLREVMVKNDRAVLLLLECRALLERPRHSLDGMACADCDQWERDRRSLLERMQKVKAWPAPVKA